MSVSTIDLAEVEKFSKLSGSWWDEEGFFKTLHEINPLRIAYIKSQILARLGGMEVSLLDIGCGGGLVTEPMSRLGARVTGIDAAKENVEAARIHGASVGLSIDYYATSAEDLAQSKKQYDVVLALEIIEHVANVPHFMQACCDLVAPGGVLIMSTINRTVKSYLLAIVGAEYILRWLPIGTHDWSKFLAPSSIAQCLRQGNLNLHEVQGMSFKPLKNEWYLSNDTQVNYLITAYK